MSTDKKLNIFQRGALQNLFTALVALLCCIVAGLVIYWLDKARLHAADITVFDIIVVAALFTAISLAVLKFSTRANLVWSVTLPNALEFSSSLRKLGVLDLKEQMNFARKHKLSVFIADTPILGDEQENVRARVYPFVRNNLLVSETSFSSNIGKRTLCLDADAFGHLVEQNAKRFSLEESVALVEKEEEIRSLKGSLASLIEDKAQLESQKAELENSILDMKNRVQTQPAQEESRVERLRIERLQWAAFIPVMDRLMRNAPEGKKFTTRELEEAFAAEWEARPDLRERMQQLSGSAETKPSETLLAAVKAEFKDAGLFSSGGRPRKNS
jgi:hypothetical protein